MAHRQKLFNLKKQMNTQLQQQLMKKWMPVIEQASHIWTWSGTGEMGLLAEQASQSEFAIEQGVYMGASAFVQLTANPKLHLWCVDPFMVAGTQKCTEYFLRQFIAEGRCEIIPKYTPAAAEQLQHVAGKIDYVFIDGGHAYENVKEDIACWKPIVRQGGQLLFHDYAMEQDGSGWNGVAKAIHESLVGHYSPVPNMAAWVK